MKIISFYLPQFHCIPENDENWGKGFTEWNNVRKSKALFNGHNQPRVPLNDNYYNLLDIETIKWQARIARENHIWGFCFYHYWFGDKLLLEKPMELLLNDKSISINYCISWANENWTNQWVSNNPKIIVKQTYGDYKEWKRHFDYLLPFFKDGRYIKRNNCPVVVIYKPTNFKEINSMKLFWDKLAIQNGFNGICFISQISCFFKENPSAYCSMDFLLDYQPVDYFISKSRSRSYTLNLFKKIIKNFANRFGVDLEGKKITHLTKYAYSDVWNWILNKEILDERVVPGLFSDWDNTPRKGNKGTLLLGACPELFSYYLKQQIINCKNNYKKDFMFAFAWNEWAEGGYLEPDEKFGFGYLESIKSILEELCEVPDFAPSL